MQTFLPDPDFTVSARMLDYRRLGKQRVEALQILRALSGGGGWASHPATQMWRGYEPALRQYHDRCIDEWVARGYKNSMPHLSPPGERLCDVPVPPWLGNAEFHASHRSNLLRKDAAFYGTYGWTEPHDLPYIWPTCKTAELQNS